MAFVSPRFCWAVLWLGVSSACSVDLLVDEDALIACRGDQDCPDGFECDARTSLCVSKGTNYAPTVEASLLTVRPITSAQVRVVLRDRNLDAVLSLEVSARRDGGDWIPITLIDAPETYENDGEVTLTWDITADVTEDAALIGSTPVDLDGDGTEESTMPAHTPIELQLVPRDQAGKAGEPLALGPFDVGHSHAGLSWSLLASDFAAEVPMEITLIDDAADTVTAELEFQIDRDQPWRTALIVLGRPDALPTDATPGATSVVVWDSLAAVESDPTTPQGAGRAFSNDFSFRIRIVEFDGAEAIYGPWVTQDQWTLINSSPPQIDNLHVVRADSAAGRSPTAISFSLSDRQSDLVDIAVEYSFDQGRTWIPASEHPTAFSGGRYGLASQPEYLGGVPHVWYWDATDVIPYGTFITQLRMRARDAFSPEETRSSVTVGRPLTADSGPLSSTNFQQFCAYYMTTGDPCSISPKSATTGDYNEDGLPDFAISNGGGRVGVFLSFLVGDFMLHTRTVYAVHSPRTVVSAHLDDDEHLDIITVQENIHVDGGANGEDVAILWGDGSGGFSLQATLESGIDPATTTRAHDVTVGDFDGDQIMDIVTDNASLSTLGFLRGLGSRAFASAVQIDLGFSSRRLAAADIDGDGRDELLVGGNSQINFLNVNADGTWTLRATIDPDVGTNGLEVADINGDGELDIAIGSSFQIATLTGDGSFGFTESNPYPAGEKVENVRVGDINQDQFPDLLVADSTGGRVDVYFGQGAGGVPAGQFVRGASFIFDQSPADVLPVVNPRRDEVRILVAGQDPWVVTLDTPNDQIGFFTERTDAPAAALPSKLYPVDLDLDGAPDLVGFSDYDDAVRLRNSTERDLGVGIAALQSELPPFPAEWLSQVGDLNGDAVPDLVTRTEIDSTNTWVVMWGPLDVAQPPMSVVTTEYLYGVTLADVTGNGWPDIVASGSGDKAWVFANQGSGAALDARFAAIDLLAPNDGTGPTEVTTGDFDGDGDVDMAFGYDSCSFLIVDSLAAQGGGFDTPQEIPCTGLSDQRFISALTSGDVNGDGHLDLLWGYYGHVAAACGDGAGGFTFVDRPLDSVFQREVFGTTGPIDLPNKVSLGDLNADGFADILLTGETYGEMITLFRNTTSTVCSLAGGNYALGVDDYSSWFAAGALMDANRDGMLDIFLAHSDSNAVRKWLGEQMAPIRPFNAPFGRGRADIRGTSLLLAGNDLFGQPYRRDVIAHHPEIVLADGRPADFVRDLYHQTSIEYPDGTAAGPPQGLRIVTTPTVTSGDERFRRVPDDSGECPNQPYRTGLVPFFGPETAGAAHPSDRQGLGSLASNEGLVVRLSLKPAIVAGGLPDPTTYRVYQRVTDWIRADEWPDDTAPVGMPDVLPRVLDNDGNCQTIYASREFFREIRVDDDGDFDAGATTGPRFIIEDGGKTVTILTDRLGTFAAFAQ